MCRVAAIGRRGVSKLLALRARLLEGMHGAFAWLWATFWPSAEEGANLPLAEGVDVAECLREALLILAG